MNITEGNVEVFLFTLRVSPTFKSREGDLLLFTSIRERTVHLTPTVVGSSPIKQI